MQEPKVFAVIERFSFHKYSTHFLKNIKNAVCSDSNNRSRVTCE